MFYTHDRVRSSLAHMSNEQTISAVPRPCKLRHDLATCKRSQSRRLVPSSCKLYRIRFHLVFHIGTTCSKTLIRNAKPNPKCPSFIFISLEINHSSKTTSHLSHISRVRFILHPSLLGVVTSFISPPSQIASANWVARYECSYSLITCCQQQFVVIVSTFDIMCDRRYSLQHRQR